MEQLKMIRPDGTPYKKYDLPDGYSISLYKGEEDKQPWCECCKDGLVGDDAGPETFDECITECCPRGLNLYTDVFFLDYGGEHVGTTTAYIHTEDNTGDMHMVGIRKDFRGKGLAKYLTQLTIERLDGKCRYSHLTTDEWRKPAIKGYISGGFCPVLYDEWMERRWQAIVNQLGLTDVPMLNNDSTPYKTLSKRQVLRFGVIGKTNLGLMEKYCRTHSDAVISASYFGSDFESEEFNEFFKADMDCLVISGNAALASKAMKTGLNILETAAPATTAEEYDGLFGDIKWLDRILAYVDPESEEAADGIHNFILKCQGDNTSVTTDLGKAEELFHAKL